MPFPGALCCPFLRASLGPCTAPAVTDEGIAGGHSSLQGWSGARCWDWQFGIGGAWKTAQFQSPVLDRGDQSSPSHRPVPSRQPPPLPSAAVLTSEQMSRGSGNERRT